MQCAVICDLTTDPKVSIKIHHPPPWFLHSLTTVSILVGQGCYPVGWLELSSPKGLGLSRPQLYTNVPFMVIMGTEIPERHPRGSLGSRGTPSCPMFRAATWLLVVIGADCPANNVTPCHAYFFTGRRSLKRIDSRHVF